MEIKRAAKAVIKAPVKIAVKAYKVAVGRKLGPGVGLARRGLRNTIKAWGGESKMPKKTPHQKFAEGLYEACTGMKLKEASPVLRGALIGAGVGAIGNAAHTAWQQHKAGAGREGRAKVYDAGVKGALVGGAVGAGVGHVAPKTTKKLARTMQGVYRGAKYGSKGHEVTALLPNKHKKRVDK
jgi:hypothetical protein